jgi:hypothetical protein
VNTSTNCSFFLSLVSIFKAKCRCGSVKPHGIGESANEILCLCTCASIGTFWAFACAWRYCSRCIYYVIETKVVDNYVYVDTSFVRDFVYMDRHPIKMCVVPMKSLEVIEINVDIGTADALSFILKSHIRNSIRSAYLKSNDPNWKSKVIKFSDRMHVAAACCFLKLQWGMFSSFFFR